MSKSIGSFPLFLIKRDATCATADPPPNGRRGCSHNNVREIIRDLETDTDRFKGSLDHALDRSSINSGRAEDEINDYVRKFEEATDRWPTPIT